MMSVKQLKRAQAVMEAAMISLQDNNKSVQKLADEADVSRSSVNAARLILEFGTPEEIEAVSSSRLGFRTVAKNVHDRIPEETRLALKRRASSWNDERRELFHGDAAIWARLSPALRNLAEMPDPMDVMTMVKSNTMRELAVDKYLNEALNWIGKFQNAWAWHQLQKSGGTTTHSGNGNPVVGAQQLKSSSK